MKLSPNKMLSIKARERNTAGEFLPPRPLREISRYARNDKLFA